MVRNTLFHLGWISEQWSAKLSIGRQSNVLVYQDVPGCGQIPKNIRFVSFYLAQISRDHFSTFLVHVQSGTFWKDSCAWATVFLNGFLVLTGKISKILG